MNYSRDNQRSPILDSHIAKHGSNGLRGVDQDMAPEQLFNLGVPFAIEMAAKHSHYRVDLDDLIQQALMGMWIAAQKFDPEHSSGAGFLTYAKDWCRAYINQYAAEMAGPVRVPVNLWTGARDRERRDEVVTAIAKSVSLNSTQHDEAPALIESLVADVECPAEAATTDSELSVVREAIAALPERHAYVVTRLFGLDGSPPCALDEAGYAVGVSRERARQLKEQAFAFIRNNGGGEFSGVHAAADDYGIDRSKCVGGRNSWRHAKHLSQQRRLMTRFDDSAGLPVCPHCRGERVIRRGPSKGRVRVMRYECKDCRVTGSGVEEYIG